MTVSPEDLERTLHELRVHQLELEAQNAELRRTQAELETERARYFDFYDLAPVGYLTVSELGLVTQANLTAATMLGLPRAVLLERPITALITAEGQDIYYRLRKQILETGVAQSCELRMRRSGDAPFWAHIDATIVPCSDAASELRVVLSDVSVRVRSDEVMRFQAAAIETTSNPVIITDAAGSIEWVNPAFSVITGYTPKEVIGRTPRILQSGGQSPAVYAELWRAITAGRSWQGELINRRKDGGLYTQAMTITPMTGCDGAVTHFVAVQHDITEQKNLEHQLRQTQKLEAVGRLAGGIAHDFNNVLTSILGSASELREASLAPGEREALLDEIMEGGNRAAELTRQLLLFSSQQTPAKRALDLNETVARMAKMLERIIGEQISLSLECAPERQPIVADEGMLGQVLLNLAVNARDAMTSGGRLIIRTEGVSIGADGEPLLLSDERAPHRRLGPAPGGHPPSDPAAGLVCLSVIDDGQGMTPQVLERVFEPFFTTKAIGKGTGLGLATVYGIVQLHRGWIEVESSPERGTTVRVLFPRSSAPIARPDVRTAAHEVTSHGGTILLVEDEPAVRRLVRTILSKAGYQVIESASGRAALALWPAHRSDIQLLLTDVVMPDGMTGPELARQLFADKPDLRVILMSGYSPDAEESTTQLGRNFGYLSKPFRREALLDAVRGQFA